MLNAITLSVVMLNVVTLSVVTLSVVTLSVITLKVIMLSVVMLSVVARFRWSLHVRFVDTILQQKFSIESFPRSQTKNGKKMTYLSLIGGYGGQYYKTFLQL
jgi:hypothetical protein